MVATFRVEAPAHARVMVKRRDLRVAQVILRSIRSDSVDLDWDEIDVGTRDDLRSAERDVHRQRSGLHVVGSGFGAPDSARLAPDEPPRSAAGNTLLVVGIVCIVITVLAAARNASWSATLPTGIAGALLLVLGTVLNRDRVPIHPRRTAGSPPQRP
jgi:hypothetical protein